MGHRRPKVSRSTSSTELRECRPRVDMAIKTFRRTSGSVSTRQTSKFFGLIPRPRRIRDRYLSLLVLPLLVAACAPKEQTLDASNASSSNRLGTLSRPTNVILIVLDTVRPDHLSVHGYERRTSPHLDALAEKSLVFTNAYSTTTWTIPAHAIRQTTYRRHRERVETHR